MNSIAPPTQQQQLNGTSDRQKEAINDLVFSYMTLRNLIGFSGMLLPIILVLATSKESGDKVIEPSISDYYYTSNGDIFVVMISMLSVFLFTYNGYCWKEKILTTLASICGIAVAFNPTTTKYARVAFSVHTFHEDVPRFLGYERHLIFAGIFILALAIISLVYFPKSDSNSNSGGVGNKTQKEKRNILYKVCGWTMIGSLIVLAIYFLVSPFHDLIGNFPIIFYMEALAVEAFGVSWLTKGETLWPDGEHYIIRGLKILGIL